MLGQGLSEAATKQQCETVSGMLKVLANPQRLMILCSLSEGERTVSELEKICGTSQPVISQHLTRMRLEGFVTPRKESNYVYYSITNERVHRLMQALHDAFCN